MLKSSKNEGMEMLQVLVVEDDKELNQAVRRVKIAPTAIIWKLGILRLTLMNIVLY